MPIHEPLGHHSAETPGASSLRHVMVCLDRSLVSESCLAAGIGLARATGARITLLHVLEGPGDAPAASPTDALDWQILREEARSYLDGLRTLATEAGLEAQVSVVQGHAAQQIITAMRKGLHTGSRRARWSLGVASARSWSCASSEDTCASIRAFHRRGKVSRRPSASAKANSTSWSRTRRG